MVYRMATSEHLGPTLICSTRGSFAFGWRRL